MPSPIAHLRNNKTLRGALLGATAVVAVAGFAGQAAFSPNHAIAAQTAQPLNIAPGSFADTVERVRGAVVSVKVNIVESAANDDEESGPSMPRLKPGDPLERFFRQFGGQIPGMPNGGGRHGPRMGQAQGSGFIISSDGYVVTNNHVVENAKDVKVTLDDGRTVAAKVIGADKKSDLALLKIGEGGNYPHVDWASATPRVGDWVIAVGNPFGLGGTVTAGIVSARGRDIGSGPYDDYLQIDAPVNRGNSGGPTFNAAGDVVGVNTAIYSPSGGSVGIGFAIPAEVAKDVIASLKDKGSVSRGWIGVQIQPVTPEIADSLGLKGEKGALVADTQANSPAAAAGIHSGDVITAVNGDRIDGPRELARKIASLGPEKSASLTYVHDGAEKTANVTLGVLPNDQAAKSEAPARVDPSSFKSFGLTLSPATGGKGVTVAEVDPDGSAAQKGIREGDTILEVAGHAVSRPADVRSAIDAARKDGRKAVLMRVKSGEGTRFVALGLNAAG
jgi:serine protease Do